MNMHREPSHATGPLQPRARVLKNAEGPSRVAGIWSTRRMRNFIEPRSVVSARCGRGPSAFTNVRMGGQREERATASRAARPEEKCRPRGTSHLTNATSWWRR